VLFPNDKQVGAAVFDLAQPDRGAFQGIVDTGFRYVPHDPAGG
jgi:hypothetical protein